MISPEMAISIRETQYINNSKVTAEAEPIQKKSRPIPNDTAWHEGAHLTVLKMQGISGSATIIPSGNALGLTYPAEHNDAAAMAAHAMGFGGTGHDRTLVRGSESAASSAAKSILIANFKEWEEISTTLQEDQAISDSGADEAIVRARKKEEVIFHLNIECQTGEIKQITRTSKDGYSIMVPVEIFDSSKVRS